MSRNNMDKIIEDTLKVINVVKKEKMEADKEYIYECPICNGKLHALKVSYNGHLRVACEKCKFSFME